MSQSPAATDRIIRYATTIQKMAINAPFDFEDRESLRLMAEEIEVERRFELQERVTPSLGPDFEVAEYAV